MRQKKRKLHELLNTEIDKSGTITANLPQGRVKVIVS